MNEPHRFQPVHSRHEDIEKQQIEFSGFEDCQPFAAIAGDGNAVAGSFEQKFDGGLDGAVVIHNQYFCQSRLSANLMMSILGCESVAGVAQALLRQWLAVLLKNASFCPAFMHGVG